MEDRQPYSPVRPNSFGEYDKANVLFGYNISPRLFLADGTNNPYVTNVDYYPSFFPFRFADATRIRFLVMNSTSSSLGQEPDGSYVSGWDQENVTNNWEKMQEIVAAFPRRMFHNLVLVPGEDGLPVPIAGSYFVKLMDHAPGTLPLSDSCLITEYIDNVVTGTDEHRICPSTKYPQSQGEGTITLGGCTGSSVQFRAGNVIIPGTLDLNGSEEGTTAINTLGKSNTIDGGTFDES